VSCTPTTLYVLVVDDDRDSADSLAILLQLWGHEARVAYDGPSALKTAMALKPDVILLDLGLPGMDGYEMARQVRSEAGMDGVLLWALTGYGQEQDRVRCHQAGIDRHLVKPFDLEELRTLLAAVPEETSYDPFS
jgi:DNA-binding response OmpR family regulator